MLPLVLVYIKYGCAIYIYIIYIVIVQQDWKVSEKLNIVIKWYDVSVALQYGDAIIWTYRTVLLVLTPVFTRLDIISTLLVIFYHKSFCVNVLWKYQ